MSTNGWVRAPWGIAVHGFHLVIALLFAVVVAALTLRLWALDSVPMEIKMLLPLGSALFAGGFTWAMILGIRWQVRGVLPRPRDGVLVLSPPRALHPSLILACAGAWLFVIGGIWGAFDLALNTSTSGTSVGVLVLALAGVAWFGFVAVRMTGIGFVADGWGLRWQHPLWPSSTQLPWARIVRIEVRGWGSIAMRVVLTTTEGRSRLVWLNDPTVPASRESIRELIAEIEGLRPDVATSSG